MMSSQLERIALKARAGATRAAAEIHGIGSLAWCRLSNRFPARISKITDLARLLTIRNQADAALATNILPFWAKNAPDRVYGGFVTHLDRDGSWSGVSQKYLVPQA